MIGQQINLYQDRFREKRLWVSAQQLAGSMLLLVLAISGWSFLMSHQLDAAEQRNREIQASQQSVATELSAANAELAKLLQDNRVEREIENMSRQISARKKVLNFVEGNQFGSGEGFSSYLVALSQLHVKDIWLNQIRLAENYVGIKGSSLNAEQVPGYFERFNGERVFQGNRFDLFQIERSKDTDWKVEFEIATVGAASEK